MSTYNKIFFFCCLLALQACSTQSEPDLVLPLFDWCKDRIEFKKGQLTSLKNTEITYEYFSPASEYKSSIIGVMKIKINAKNKEEYELYSNTIKYMCLPTAYAVEDLSPRGMSNMIQQLYTKGPENHVYVNMVEKKVYVQTPLKNR